MRNILKIENFMLVLFFLFSFSITGCDQIDPGSMPSADIQAVVKFALSSSYSANCDSILLSGTSKALTANDFIYLAGNCQLKENCDRILFEGAKKAQSTSDFVHLAQHCQFKESCDSILHQGAEKAQSASDFVSLADNCQHKEACDRILVEGAKKAQNVNDFTLLAQHCQFKSTTELITQMGVNFITENADSLSLNTAQSSPSVGSAKVKKAYEEMTQAYHKYEEAIKNASADLKNCEDEFVAKKAVYESLVKNN